MDIKKKYEEMMDAHKKKDLHTAYKHAKELRHYLDVKGGFFQPPINNSEAIMQIGLILCLARTHKIEVDLDSGITLRREYYYG